MRFISIDNVFINLFSVLLYFLLNSCSNPKDSEFTVKEYYEEGGIKSEVISDTIRHH
jgi:hypothetical protein